ncbi:MAG TPA: nitrilase-related carbon-nitrogen hydrolase [Geminicoccaceae bacterium]|nr:nitrilase-related carbon-nitrogen hydrolase [Geminicoccus sp.]HMU50960.1 nitrilase-related carbon-nitrogen hydrolase [Geminicoccaceae bacterium]
MRLAFSAPPPGALAPAVAAAAGRGASLLVLPEAADDAPPEPSDGGPAIEAAGLARRHGIAILRGYVERCVTGIYGAAMLIDRQGVCIANYRQAHLRDDVQRRDPARRPGQWLSAMPVEGVRLGLLIGYDIEFPEPARALALAGCGLIAVLGGASDSDAGMLLPARARENRCWIAQGGAAPRLVGPDGAGRRLTEAAGGVWLGDAEGAGSPDAARAALMAARQPRLYQELVIPRAAEQVRPS